jgi:hypothetical protein
VSQIPFFNFCSGYPLQAALRFAFRFYPAAIRRQNNFQQVEQQHSLYSCRFTAGRKNKGFYLLYFKFAHCIKTNDRPNIFLMWFCIALLIC